MVAWSAFEAICDKIKRHKNYLVDSKEQHQKEQELLLC